IPGAGYAKFAVLAGVFITAFYSFRMYFLVFHGPERFRNRPVDHHGHDGHGDHHHGGEPHESPAVVWVPLGLLAVPSLFIGYLTVARMLAGDYFEGAIHVSGAHHAMEEVAHHAAHPGTMGLHAFATWPFWLALAGVALAWFLYLKRPELPGVIAAKARPLVTILDNKYYFDWFNENVIARAARLLGTGLWRAGDRALIDGALVNGSALTIRWAAGIVRRVQTGFLYTYAFWMVIGLAVLLGWYLVAG